VFEARNLMSEARNLMMRVGVGRLVELPAALLQLCPLLERLNLEVPPPLGLDLLPGRSHCALDLVWGFGVEGLGFRGWFPSTAPLAPRPPPCIHPSTPSSLSPSFVRVRSCSVSALSRSRPHSFNICILVYLVIYDSG